MEITSKNFLEQLPSIRQTIQEANFFAIDGEFTGLTSDRNVYPFDTPEEVYLKTIQNSTNFVIVQLGLCAFKLNPDTGHWSYKCYNFYCYPKGRTQVFACQGESIRFLADNGFDFNKLFSEGLSYCGEVEEQRKRAELKDRQAQRAAALKLTEDEQNDEKDSLNMIPVPTEEEKLISDISERIENFIKSEDKELAIANCNGFQRKLVYQLIDSKFQKLVSTASVVLENNQKAILVERKRTKKQEMQLEADRIAQENNELENAVGLSLVLQELSKARKLVVGHNMLLDLLFVIRQFFRPLPNNFQEFKKTVRELFPMLLDTKYLCTNGELKVHVNSSVLGHVFEAVKKAPFKMPEVVSELENHQYSQENMKLHEAGYDAYLTGICFLGLISYFKVDTRNLSNDPILKSYFNRIFLLRVSEINFIHTHGKEPSFSREHIFFVTFPENWRQSDIVTRFRNYGPIHVSWVNNTSAFVTLHNRDYASHVIRTIEKSQINICTFNQFKAKQQRTGIKRRHDSGGPDREQQQQLQQQPKGSEEKEEEATLALPKVNKVDGLNFGSPSKAKNMKTRTFADNDDW
ncbi:poly(A)-specific ribonuclease PARN-like isoform X2 [Toxorhynchites rutilus septentrionalis]|uniref:poly(A)-specific ribonuclease PARN-like isoform X2 n=1 Tax=Toxorhynchites rutilus septentrionalis TaxID=329112 RepID=UPI00247A14EA|nr:poly(A)-specific ribonuclease PARN-like isoform X2 [Toxorhynchites rutilus septentrionalis]